MLVLVLFEKSAEREAVPSENSADLARARSWRFGAVLAEQTSRGSAELAALGAVR